MKAEKVDYEELIDYVKKYQFDEKSCETIKQIVSSYTDTGLHAVIYVNLGKMVFEHLHFNTNKHWHVYTGKGRQEIDNVMGVLEVLYPDIVKDYTDKFMKAGQ